MVDVILTTINAILLCVAGVSVILFLLKKDVWRLLMQ